MKKQILETIVLITTAGVLSACTVAPPVAAPIPTGTSAIRALALGSGTAADPYIVTINFNTAAGSCEILSTEADPTTCASGSSLCAERDQWIQWQSNPASIRYDIYFDPLNGSTLAGNGAGTTPKKKIDSDAPIANYKYSIVKDGCDPTLANTFDPRIRVNK